MSDRPSTDRRALMLLTVFGLGLLRPAPGTWGSLPPVVLAFVCAWLVDRVVIDVVLVGLCVVSCFACIALGAAAERIFKGKDPSQVVIDETAGQCIALLVLPWRMDGADALACNASIAACAFLSFRLFDIIKPPPAFQLQRLKLGWGVLLDDIAAGVYALIVTQLFARLLLPAMMG